jgi:ABC-type multidrug transport system ATPase subunit
MKSEYSSVVELGDGSAHVVQKSNSCSWSLCWENVTISTSQSTGKCILKDISGHVGPGELLAIMGPSGSGKSTLLDAIGGRLQDRQLKVSGNLLMGSFKDSVNKTQNNMGYVTQDDQGLAVFHA